MDRGYREFDHTKFNYSIFLGVKGVYKMECLKEADGVISDLKKNGHDYSQYRIEIEKLFSEYLYNGEWDMTSDFYGDKEDLRFIQEDHYDQHMDHDEDKPSWDDMICFTEGHYIFPA